MDASTIRILVEASSVGVGPGLAPGIAAFNRFGDSVTQSFQKITAGVAGLGTAEKVLLGFGTAATVAGTALLTVAVPAAIKFQSAFADVEKTVDGTPAALGRIRDGILEMTTVMPTAAEELAGIAANAGQLGVAAPDVLTFTETIAKLGETTDLSFDNASESAARFLNITGGGAGNIDQFADAVVFLGNNSATTETQIVSFAQRLVAAFTLAGATETEILALGAGFSSLGLNAEAGGTALSRTITAISEASKPGGENLEKFAEVAGVLPDQFARIAAEDPTEALLLFLEGLNGISASSQALTPVLEGLGLGGTRLAEALKLGSIGTDALRESLRGAEAAVAAGTAANDEYAKRAETAAARIEIFGNKLKLLAIQAGTPLLEPVADAFDLVGNAALALGELFGPLASEIVILFANMAEAAGVFFEVFGSPVLGVGIAALTGLVSLLTLLVQGFNSLGTAGVVLAGIAASLVAFGPGAVAVTTLSVGLVGVGGAAGIAAAGVGTFLASIAPIAIPIALVATLGKAFIDAGKKADEAGAKVQSGFVSSLENADLAGFNSQMEQTIARINELDQIDNVSDDLTQGFSEWRTAITSVLQVLTPFTENTVVNARAEQERLNEVIAENGWGRLNDDLALVGSNLGLTAQQVLQVGTELGIMNLLTDGTTAGFYEFRDAVAAGTANLQPLADTLGTTVDSLLEGEVGLEGLASGLDLSAESVAYLVEQLDGVSMDDITDPTVQAAVVALAATYEELGAQVGLTGEEVIAQLDSVDALAASYNVLQSAVNEASNALALLEAQEQAVTEAQTAFNEALASGDIEATVSSMRDLTLAYAASGVSAGEALRFQDQLAESVTEAGRAAGLSEDEIRELVTTMGLVPEAIITKLSNNGLEAKADVDQLVESLEETEKNRRARIDLEAARASSDLSDLNISLDEFKDQAERRTDVEVDTGTAAADIGDLQRAIDALRDKTVTISVETRGGGSVGGGGGGGTPVAGPRATGGISFAAGGMVPVTGMEIKEPAGMATIYAPSARNRIHSEPVTGGESYIPLTDAPVQRQRSLQIWRETGRLLGALGGSNLRAVSHGTVPAGDTQGFATGGITTGTFSNGPGQLPTVVVDVQIDTQALGSLSVDLNPIQQTIAKTVDVLEEAERGVITLGDALPIARDEAISFGDVLPIIRDGFDEVSQAAIETGRDVAESFRPSEIVEVFAEVTRMSEEEFRKLLGNWDGTLEDAVASLEAMGIDTDTIFRAIGESGREASVSIVDAFSEVGLDISAEAERIGEAMIAGLDSEQFLTEFERISGWAKDSFVDWLASFDEASAARLATLREEGATTQEIFDDMFDVSDALDILRDSGLELGGIFRQMFEEGASSADVLDVAIGVVGDSVDDVDRAIRRATDAFDLLEGRTRNVIDAQLDYLNAVQRVNDAIDEGGAFGLDSDEARRNLEDLLRAGDAMREYGLEVAASGISAEEAVNKFNALKEEFAELARQAGLSDEEVDQLVETLFGVPEETIVQIAVEGEEAAKDIEALGDALDELGEMNPEPSVGLDTSEFEDGAQGVRDGIIIIDEATGTPKIDIDTSSWDEGRSRVEGEIVLLDQSNPIPSIGIDTNEWDGGNERVLGDIINIASQNPVPTVGINTADFDGGNARVLGEIVNIASQNPTPSVSLDAGNFFGQANSVAGRLQALNGTRAVTFIDVVTRSDGSSARGGPLNFAQGGFYEPEIARDGAYRVFAEKGTGGEAFIPLANDYRRPRALSLWEETGRRLGVMMNSMGSVSGRPSAGGGLSIQADINIPVYASPGMDTSEVARMVSDGVREGLAAAGRDLANTRSF